jgi:lysophospholipase L1-like esterase
LHAFVESKSRAKLEQRAGMPEALRARDRGALPVLDRGTADDHSKGVSKLQAEGRAGRTRRLWNAALLLLFALAPGLVACKEPAPRPTSAPFAWSREVDPSSAEFEHEIRAFELEDAKAPRRRGEILFVGSSSIRLWRSLSADFAPHPVKNRGFGGARIRNIIDFGRRMVLPYEPSRIVFFAGSNDINAGARAQSVLSDFQLFVRGVHEVLPQTRIAFVSITTSPARFAEVGTVREANRLVREYVATEPRLSFIDVFPAMLDAAGRPRAELYVEDRLHLNRQGYALWIPLIEPFLRN